VSGNWITIQISDSGIGIPGDKKEKIFERFFQNATTASILNQGSGIGLSITKEFVQMHGGSIEVESEFGNGATFCIHLPFEPIFSGANNPDQQPVQEAERITTNGRDNFSEKFAGAD
jgi:signal transduction histidine kinase